MVLALTLLLAAAPPTPAPLLCLQRLYAVMPVPLDGGWAGELPDGTRVPYGDGALRPLPEREATPTLRDLWSIPYPRGPIEPVNEVDADPGRVRVDALFLNLYGRSAHEVEQRLVPLDFLGQRLRVHARVAPAFERVVARLRTLLKREPSLGVYLAHAGGTFNWRPIAGSDKLSAHSFGISLDINVKHSAYWQWQKPALPIAWRNQIPEAIVAAFEAEGFIWGGRWYHYDTMHFEYRPELIDARCWP
jgi:hypothetical protein